VQRFDRAHRPPHEFPAAVRALAVQAHEGAFGTKCAFKRADHCIARIGRQVAIAALAIRFDEKHGGHLTRCRNVFNLIRHAPIQLRRAKAALAHRFEVGYGDANDINRAAGSRLPDAP
jgi:hypothetical protein